MRVLIINKFLYPNGGCAGRKGENDYRKGLFPVRP